jgi:hypothetical protein
VNAVELFHKDGRPASVFYCGQCRIVHKHQEHAEQCCKNYLCSDCGKDTGSRSWLICDTCRSLRDVKKERERFEKAEKVADWDGFVYCEGFGREGFCESLDVIYEECDDEEKTVPEYAWTCTPNRFAVVTIDDIKDRIIDSGDCYEDFSVNDLNGLKELEAALDAFNESNSGVLSYQPDYKKAVLLQPLTNSPAVHESPQAQQGAQE